MLYSLQAQCSLGSPHNAVSICLVELFMFSPHMKLQQFLEEALRDCLVCGMISSSTQKKFFAKRDLTLQRAINIATAAEIAVLDHQQEMTMSA